MVGLADQGEVKVLLLDGLVRGPQNLRLPRRKAAQPPTSTFGSNLKATLLLQSYKATKLLYGGTKWAGQGMLTLRLVR